MCMWMCLCVGIQWRRRSRVQLPVGWGLCAKNCRNRHRNRYSAMAAMGVRKNPKRGRAVRRFRNRLQRQHLICYHPWGRSYESAVETRSCFFHVEEFSVGKIFNWSMNSVDVCIWINIPASTTYGCMNVIDNGTYPLKLASAGIDHQWGHVCGRSLTRR